MAGDDDGPGYSQWDNIYGDNPNKYKGFWKYYNTDTPFGRAKVIFVRNHFISLCSAANI